ncbi:serine/threonine-protein phosphatase [candidate division KSB1 bacterium]|nr:serine/threonine-protein phosphatase [candidate division KSB1 bacterium]
MIWRNRPGKFEKLESQNPIVGFDQAPEERFRQQVTNIATGDKLLMYTDGIIEAENANNEALGLRGMLNFCQPALDMPANDIADRIITGLEQWSGGPRRDDVYLLVASVH